MSDKKGSSWMALPWALIAAGIVLAALGGKELADGNMFEYGDPVIGFIVLALVLFAQSPVAGSFHAAWLSALLAPGLMHLWADPDSLTAETALLSGRAILLASFVIAVSCLGSKGTVFTFRGLFASLCNIAAAAGVVAVISTGQGLIILPAGAAAFVIGVLLALLLRKPGRPASESVEA